MLMSPPSPLMSPKLTDDALFELCIFSSLVVVNEVVHLVEVEQHVRASAAAIDRLVDDLGDQIEIPSMSLTLIDK